MATEEIFEGGCLCGAVRYRFTGAPHHVSHCHCTMCRRASGAPVVTWATVREDRLAFAAGELRWFQSSDHARRGFCARCGTPLFFSSTRFPGWIDVTAASLDQPERLTPTHHIYEPDRLAWLIMTDGLPRHREGSGSPLV